MAEVLVINPTKTVVKINELKRVGAYIRVSSDSEDQENSFVTQYDHYMNLIANNPEWTLVDIYKDDGITGTEMECRDDFNRMYQDCVDGKLDLILTKSISRFARNTYDCIDTTRKFKILGVDIIFEKENIDTSRMTSETELAALSSMAQEALSFTMQTIGEITRTINMEPFAIDVMGLVMVKEVYYDL